VKPVTIKILQATHAYFGIGGDAPWQDHYRFTTDPACSDYDWLVVYDEFDAPETLACPRERTILATWEPVSIKSYSHAYTRQFGHLLTNRPPEAERHPHYHLGRGYFHWFLGRSYAACVETVLPPKTADLSLVCSVKRMRRRTRHLDRFHLVEAIHNAIPESVWYGSGLKPVLNKYEALDDYRYTVAVENHIAPHHWTEKLADALLAECLLFYAGDPAIAEALPADCLVPIPLDDPNEAVRIIRATIAEGGYEKRRGAVLEAKRLILEKYNFWMQVIGVIEASEGQPLSAVDPSRPLRIWPRTQLRWHSLSAAIEDGIGHLKRLI